MVGDPVPVTQARRTSVLIVDDDGDFLDMLRRMLETAGYEVRCAVNAEAAIAAYLEQAPDLILTDVYMPEADGFELINWLRSRKATPVIAMSGAYTAPYNHLAVAEQLGAVAVIGKPFRRAALIEVIETALARAAL
jgi:CheY-like chemotaxis protein